MKVGMQLQNDTDVAPDKESTDTTTYINLVYRY
jgi:putative salt-induced outer membrane protein YdiY